MKSVDFTLPTMTNPLVRRNTKFMDKIYFLGDNARHHQHVEVVRAVGKAYHPSEPAFECILAVNGVPTRSAVFDLDPVVFTEGISDWDRQKYEGMITTLSTENDVLKWENKHWRINWLKKITGYN